MSLQFRLHIVSAFLVPLSCSWTNLVIGQNLVPNYDFELYYECPDAHAQVNKCVGWSEWAHSPDYHNACSPGIEFLEQACDVPSNLGGYQPALSGNGYMGMYCSTPEGSPIVPYREYIGVELKDSLVIGCTYHVEFYAVAGQGGWTTPTNEFSNNLGILFTTHGFDSNSDEVPTYNTAHVYETEIITDTVNWQIISGQFIADQQYSHLGIGNWFDDDFTTTLLFNEEGDEGSYYYIENVCVRGISPCFADLTGDGLVSVYDLLVLLADFGCQEECVANFTCDQKVDIQDVLFFLSVYGEDCDSCQLE